MRVFGIGRCPAIGNFAVLDEPPKPPLPLAKHSLPLRLEIRPVTRPVLLAVLAVLPRQFLRLFVDPIEYRQAVGEAPQNEPESLSARPPGFICFLHEQIIGGLERRHKWGWGLNFSIPTSGGGYPDVWCQSIATHCNSRIVEMCIYDPEDRV